MVATKTLRQINREAERTIARLNKPMGVHEMAKELVNRGQAVSMSEAKRRVIQNDKQQLARLAR
jgi:CTP-dependent riboflavin kinase